MDIDKILEGMNRSIECGRIIFMPNEEIDFDKVEDLIDDLLGNGGTDFIDWEIQDESIFLLGNDRDGSNPWKLRFDQNLA